MSSGNISTTFYRLMDTTTRYKIIVGQLHTLLDTEWTDQARQRVLQFLYQLDLRYRSLNFIYNDPSLVTKLVNQDVVEFFLLLDQKKAYSLLSCYFGCKQADDTKQPYLNAYYQQLGQRLETSKLSCSNAISPDNSLKQAGKQETVGAADHQHRQLNRVYKATPLQALYFFIQYLTVMSAKNIYQRISTCIFVLFQSYYIFTIKSRQQYHYAHYINNDLEVQPRMRFTYDRCDKCKLVKDRQQVHCRYCDICVDGFDHHCWFLNCCISKHNFSMFFKLLLAAFVHNFYVLLSMGLGQWDATYKWLHAAVYIYLQTVILIHINKLHRIE